MEKKDKTVVTLLSANFTDGLIVLMINNKKYTYKSSFYHVEKFIYIYNKVSALKALVYIKKYGRLYNEQDSQQTT